MTYEDYENQQLEDVEQNMDILRIDVVLDIIDNLPQLHQVVFSDSFLLPKFELFL